MSDHWNSAASPRTVIVMRTKMSCSGFSTVGQTSSIVAVGAWSGRQSTGNSFSPAATIVSMATNAAELPPSWPG